MTVSTTAYVILLLAIFAFSWLVPLPWYLSIAFMFLIFFKGHIAAAYIQRGLNKLGF